MDTLKLKNSFIAKAKELGFARIGITRAIPLEEEKQKLIRWIDNRFNAGMSYMANSIERRVNPEQLLPGVKSIIVLAYNYYHPMKFKEDSYKISKYAYGKDYHDVLPEKLKQLTKFIEQSQEDSKTRICIDSSPIMEKVWARRAGLGWTGKNGCLIHPKSGSHFFLSEILTNIELEYDKPATDHCGKCRKCIDACPTGAITEPSVIDCNKCISYLTIEHKGELPDDLCGVWNNWIFGCDICQDVCPFNRFSKGHNQPLFNPKPELFAMNKTDWVNLTEEIFNQLFEGTAVKRTKYKGLMRNIKFLDEK